MEHGGSLPFVIGYGDAVFATELDDLFVVIALGAVVDQACRFRLLQRTAIPHGETDAGKGNTQ